MEIKNLRIFARVAAVCNLSQVGKEFGLTAGTISKKLQAMEDELGVRLFDRTTRSIRITDEGHTFLPFAEEILVGIDSAHAKIDQTKQRVRGRLRVSAPARVGGIDTAACICGFMEIYPEVEVSLQTNDSFVANRDEHWDVAICVGTLSDSTYIAKRLADDMQVVVASPRYLKEHGMPAFPMDLSEHDCLCMDERSQWAFTYDSKEHKVRVNGTFQAVSACALTSAAVLGRGILKTSKTDVQEHLDAGRLVQILKSFDFSGESAIWATYPSSRNTPPRLRAFVNYFRRRLRGLGDRKETAACNFCESEIQF